MATNKFDPKALTWNIHTKGIWVSKKEMLIEKFLKLDFVPSANGGWNVPAQVGAEVQRYIDTLPQNPIISAIAYDLDKPKDIVYGVYVYYCNCKVYQYLHSNGLKISVCAVLQVPHIIAPKQSHLK